MVGVGPFRGRGFGETRGFRKAGGIWDQTLVTARFGGRVMAGDAAGWLQRRSASTDASKDEGPSGDIFETEVPWEPWHERAREQTLVIFLWR